MRLLSFGIIRGSLYHALLLFVAINVGVRTCNAQVHRRSKG
jgi:hypothetical protein